VFLVDCGKTIYVTLRVRNFKCDKKSRDLEMDVELLLVVALPSEAAEILRRNPSFVREQSCAAMPFYCCTRSQHALVISGSGMVRAAMALTLVASRLRVRRYLNIGLAGALKDDLPLGAAFHCSKVLQHDSYMQRGETSHFLRPGTIDFAAGDASTELPFLEVISPSIVDLHCSTVLCGSAFIGEEGYKRKIGKWGQVVDMESSGIVQAAALLQLPGDIIKVVSDGVAGDCLKEFIDSEQMLSVRIAELYELFLGN
jgi:adenosylhomocysteine nucleosidase